MSLLFIGLACMAFTVLAKWFTSSALVSKKAKLSEALDGTGQAKYRLKAAVSAVTTTNAEIDKLKRKNKTTQRKIDRLQKEYQEFNAKAQQDAEMNAEKLRLAKELKQRKGQ